MRLSDLVSFVETEVAEVVRDCEISSVELCSLITGEKALTYIEKEKFLPALKNPRIAAVICPPHLAEAMKAMGKGVLISDAPKFAFYCLHNAWEQFSPPPKRETVIAKSARIHPRAVIAPYHVVIEDDVVIDAGAVIEEFVTIHAHTHIHAGAVIGAGSFNPARYHGKTIIMQDCGQVELGRYVDIFPNTTVIRGVLRGEVTRIDDYAKIDTLCHIAHGAHIGRGTFIASGSIIAGNCKIGKDSWVGVNATVANRICIGDEARVSLGSVVTKDVPDGQTVSGNFAIDHERFLTNLKKAVSPQYRDNCPPPTNS